MTVILGNTLNASDDKKLQSIIAKIPRFTYHKDFEPLPSGLRTDRNWGCCIRCGQSLLAQFITKFKEIAPNTELPDVSNILSLFCDEEKAPFSIHSFCREIYALGGKPGDWVRASLLARVLERILEPFHINTIVAENGTISRVDIHKALSNGNPFLLLFPLMLGPKEFDLKYLPFLEVSLSVVPQSIGVVGGQQGKAYYIVGYNKQFLYYFDPHETMEAMKSVENVSVLFRASIKKMQPSQFNSSLLIGFMITTEDDVNDLPILLGASGICPIQILDSLDNITIKEDSSDDGWNIVE